MWPAKDFFDAVTYSHYEARRDKKKKASANNACNIISLNEYKEQKRVIRVYKK